MARNENVSNIVINFKMANMFLFKYILLKANLTN